MASGSGVLLLQVQLVSGARHIVTSFIRYTQMTNDVSEDYHDMESRDPEDRTDSPTLGSGRVLLSNRISHFLNVHGPRWGTTFFKTFMQLPNIRSVKITF